MVAISGTETKTEATYDDVTYGLDQINVPDVWDQLGVTSDGAERARSPFADSRFDF